MFCESFTKKKHFVKVLNSYYPTFSYQYVKPYISAEIIRTYFDNCTSYFLNIS